MLDFVKVTLKHSSQKKTILYPEFIVKPGLKDLMTRGKDFYAIWDEANGCWSQNIERAYELIDMCIDEYIEKKTKVVGDPEWTEHIDILRATIYDTGIATKFGQYCKFAKAQSFKPLDCKVVFKDTDPNRKLYSSKRLSYNPKEMDTPGYDRLMEVLYSPEERTKIEWLAGACLCGDNDKIQKFGVLYGAPGTGKGTVMDILWMLFDGYAVSFDADALGRRSDQFALEPFKNHPVVAIQADGNLSRIEDNTRLNTLISHETLVINEKFKSKYDTKIDAVLFIGTNDPVKITNAKSGILRRLIDVEPTGKTLSASEYTKAKKKIPFELPGIAYRCQQVYLSDKHMYDGYRPMQMMAQTNDFYDFVLEYYDQFCSEEYILLSTAWTWYKKYVEDANTLSKMSRRAFASELSSYFKTGPRDEWRTDENGNKKHYSSVYRGFKKERFRNASRGGENVVDNFEPDKKKPPKDSKADAFKNLPDWLKLKDVSDSTELVESNPFNVYFEKTKAQYAVETESGGSRPKKAWETSKTKLSAIDTRLEHYVLCQETEPALIFLDFDKKDEKTGQKSLTLNLEAAAHFPKTYAETSKSGEGLHLYYIYDGDVDDLSNLYDKDIEIKKLTGKSALRRKLKFCNDEKISHISSGLPMKGNDKVINWDGIKNEKQIRTMIKKNLAREYHANTKPSIDYIDYILKSALESGVHYDVSDLRPAVMNFASGSTNNAEYCMELVCNMPFKSDEDEGPENQESKVYLEKPIAFFDWEVFPNLSILCYKVEGGVIGEEGKGEVIKIINPTANDVSAFLSNYRAIGFNNLEYDNYISYGRILGMSNDELYRLSCNVIGNKGSAMLSREAKNLSYTDIYDFSNTKQSLKKWEIELDLHHQEFPYPWDKPVPEDVWDLAADYCANDVVATECVFYHLKADWEARQVLAKISGLTVNDKTNAHTCRIIFGKNRHPQSEFNYPDLSKEFPGYEYSKFGIDTSRYNIGPDGKSVKTSGHSIFMGDDPSEGGYVYYETGIHRNVALLDIASLHPTTIEVLQLFGPYTARFSEIKAARVAIKHKRWDEARGYLDGSLAPFLEGVEGFSKEEQQDISDSLSYAIKIVINSIFGLTAASFPNPCRDPRNIDNVVAKRGALFMILLKNEVQKKGFTVAHIKTDSIKIPDATPEIIEFVMSFGKKYGYTFEHEATYEKMLLVNKAVYIAKYDAQGERTKGGRHAGSWTATGAEFQHPYIFKKLFSHEDTTFKDYCEMKSVSNGATMYLDLNEDLVKDKEQELYSLKEQLETATSGKMDLRKRIKDLQEEIDSTHNLSFVGRCGLFVPVVPGVGGGSLLRIGESSTGAVAGTKGYRWLESEYVKEHDLMDKLDMRYYRKLIDSAYDHISQYGDAEEFING